LAKFKSSFVSRIFSSISDSNLNLCPKGKLLVIFHSIGLQSLVNFGAQKGGFRNLQIQVSLENRKAFGLMNWARPGGTVVLVGFKLTTSRTSLTRNRGAGSAPRSRRTGKPSLAVVDVRDRDHPFSLSFRRIFPNAKVRTPFRSLLASCRLDPPLDNSSRIANLHFLALFLP
jgi:hypothetical protein